MANFSYEEYQAKKASSRSASSKDQTSNERVSITFMNTLLAKEGSSVVVRFPYTSMNDIIYTTTHTMVMPGFPYGKRIRCLGDNCPLCEQGVKVEDRVFVKALAYVEENNTIVPKVVIWDRPAAFADIELKSLMEEYGDISKRLFKLKRTGTKMTTRYTAIPVDRDNAVYNENTCPADFSSLEKVDASKILTKSYEQYAEVVKDKPEERVMESTEVSENVEPVKIHSTNFVTNQQPLTETVVNPQETQTSNINTNRTRRYTF